MFIKYRGANVVDARNSDQLKPDRLLLALLGAIKVGNVLVIDMAGCELWDHVEKCFDDVEQGLLRNLLSKKIFENEGFMDLITEEVEKQPGFDKKQFRQTAVVCGAAEKFTFMIVSRTDNRVGIWKDMFGIDIE